MRKNTLLHFSPQKLFPAAAKVFDSNYRILIPIIFLFIIANTFKVAIFNNLLFDSSATFFTCLYHSGIINKTLVVFFLAVICTFWKTPFFFIVFYVLQTLYMFVNLSYHSHFNGYLHINQYIELISEAFDLAAHNAVTGYSGFWQLLVDFPFFILIVIWYRKISILSRRTIKKTGLYIVGVTLIYLALIWNPLRSDAAVLDIMNNAYSSDHEVVQKYGLLAFNAMDLLNFKEVKTRIKKFEYGRDISSGATDSIHPNFILIQVESLDSYIIRHRYKNKLIMPFLASLSDNCVFYPHTLSYHKAGSTSDCEFSIISSVEPFNDYPSIKIRNYNYPNSMVKAMALGGYDNVAFHGNRGSYFNRTIAFKKMGFASFHDMNAMGLIEKSWGAPDGEVFRFVEKQLASQKPPFFYYIITMSSHEPFNFTRSYFATKAYDRITVDVVRNYYTAMTYIDGELKTFVENIKKANPNTFIFIYGDHTPAIKNHIYKSASFIEKNQLFEFVPCFIITPLGASYKENSRVASFLDIAPTVLFASKIPFKLKSNGRDLLSGSFDSTQISYNCNQYSRPALFSKIALPH